MVLQPQGKDDPTESERVRYSKQRPVQNMNYQFFMVHNDICQVQDKPVEQHAKEQVNDISWFRIKFNCCWWINGL